MPSEVLIVVGLPGCGKTTYIKGLVAKGWSDFDDFKAGAIDNSSAFGKSCRFEALISCLHDDFRCVVADIDFCKTDSRIEAEDVLRMAVPGIKIQWIFFENDTNACEKNIKRRNRKSLIQDLIKLREYSDLYSVPAGANVRRVVSENN